MCGCFVLFGNAASASSIDGGSEWSIYTIDELDEYLSIHYSYTSIAVDGDDNIHISYQGPDSDLRYAKKENDIWSIEVIYNVGYSVVRENAIALNQSPRVNLQPGKDPGRLLQVPD